MRVYGLLVLLVVSQSANVDADVVPKGVTPAQRAAVDRALDAAEKLGESLARLYAKAPDCKKAAALINSATTAPVLADMKVRGLSPAHAHHLMVEAIRANVLPASRLPKVIEAWEEPRHEAFAPRTAWSLFNAFTDVQKGACPRAQMEGSLRLSSLFRRELSLN